MADIDPSIELESGAAAADADDERQNARSAARSTYTNTGGGRGAARGTDDGASTAAGDARSTVPNDDAAFGDDADDASGYDADDGDAWDDDPDAEMVDYEEDGRRYKIPAALKGHLLRQSDYSRNMNALREEQQKFDSAREETARARAIEEATKQTLGKLANIDRELKHFARGADGRPIAATEIDWATWQKADPEGAKAALQRLTTLSRQRSSLASEALEGKRKYETEAKLRTAERLRATRNFAQKEIPNWSPERDREITRFALKELGFSERDIIDAMSPKMYRLADLALDGHRYREARAKRSASGAPSNVTPLTTVARQRSGSTGTGLSDKLTADEWVRRRNKQLQRKLG